MKSQHVMALESYINEIRPGASEILDRIGDFTKQDASAILKLILGYATSTGTPAILAGREWFAKLPQVWVRDNLWDAAPCMISLADDWDYRRLLELIAPTYPELLEQFCQAGLLSDNSEVVDAAEEFRTASSGGTTRPT